ncbi:MAG: hypothetical protein U0T78_03920 [Cloacibacterium normanense]
MDLTSLGQTKRKTCVLVNQDELKFYGASKLCNSVNKNFRSLNLERDALQETLRGEKPYIMRKTLMMP